MLQPGTRQSAAFLLVLGSLAAFSAASAQDFNPPDLGSFLKRPSGGSEIREKAIDRWLYVDRDETEVLKEPRDGGDDGLRLTQLRRGETVKILGELDAPRNVHWYKVEAPRREYDSESGGWRNTEGWVREKYEDAETRTSVANFNSDPRTARRPVDLEAGPCRQAFVKAMESFLGVPYVWGGTSHKGVDCSGLIQSAMIEAGCVRQAPPRTADDQFHAAQRRSGPEDMREGDLVFLAHPGDKIHHVIGFVGSGKVIEAPHSGAVVSISDMERRLQGASSNNQIYYGSLLGD